MHERYARINSLWITPEDEGGVSEVIRWCRAKLGGRDEDLVGPERWDKASRDGWSERATYSCLPSCGTTWARYVHEMVHWRDIRGLGNILRHEYSEVDTDAIWRIVIDDLPALKAAVQGALAGLRPRPA